MYSVHPWMVGDGGGDGEHDQVRSRPIQRVMENQCHQNQRHSHLGQHQIAKDRTPWWWGGQTDQSCCHPNAGPAGH